MSFYVNVNHLGTWVVSYNFASIRFTIQITLPVEFYTTKFDDFNLLLTVEINSKSM